MSIALVDGDKDSTDVLITIKRSMTMPSFPLVQALLKDREKFLEKTRFDQDNMNKLWTVCQSRPGAVKLGDFLGSKDVLEIFQEAPLSKAKPKTKKRTSADFTDPTSLERASPRNEEVTKNEAKVFEKIAKFRGSSDSPCSEFLTRTSGAPCSFCSVISIILQLHTPTKTIVRFHILYIRDYDIFCPVRWPQAVQNRRWL